MSSIDDLARIAYQRGYEDGKKDIYFNRYKKDPLYTDYEREFLVTAYEVGYQAYLNKQEEEQNND